MNREYDAIVVGSGPNGLAAAIALSQAGCSVLLLEAADTIGGGLRSAALTLPGFVHDVASSIHPMAAGSPFFRQLPLEQFGLEWVYPTSQAAHPFDDGSASLLERSFEETARTLGPDGNAWQRLFQPLVEGWEGLLDDLMVRLPSLPQHPLLVARFLHLALRSIAGLSRSRFRGDGARALFAGIGAHTAVPLDAPGSTALGLILATSGHVIGWPIPRGGAQSLADALAAYLRSLGGHIVTANPVTSLEDLPRARAVVLDITPRQLLGLAGERLPASYRKWLEVYRYGMAAYKVDYALADPVPWKAPECARAITVHLGGTLEEMIASERTVAAGGCAERPFVMVSQPSLFDSRRAPAGKHTLWTYCHAPLGFTGNLTARIEAQLERFAPGFKERVLARHIMGPLALEHRNPNNVGGDIFGGSHDGRQFLMRPVPALRPWRLPAPGLYLCSSSTPPGGGVHGMCGYRAAMEVLRDFR